MPSDFERELEIFEAAVRLPEGPERSACLTAACAGDDALRRRVEALLRAHGEAGAFLQSGPSGLQTALAAGSKTTLVPAIEQAGERIGRYKLREKIGEGGCGVVYVAEQEEPVRRRVALKVIKLGMDTGSVVARFEAERQALAMMDHPNIARVLDAGATDTGRPYFVMELVRGIRITDYCDQNNLSTRERLDLFIKVCQAVQHAHQKGVIHRDLKPSNILVTLHDGVPVPKVIDFGIAKATEGRLTNATVYTELHQFIGTPAYMSPEQAGMSGLDIDTRSDIYSLGVLLYELLTGTTPFDARELWEAGLDEMRRTIREKEPVRPSTRLRTELVAVDGSRRTSTSPLGDRSSAELRRRLQALRGDLDWVVMKALEKDRTRRYANSLDFAADIQRHLNHEPVLAGAPGNLYKLRKLIRRNKGVFAATAAVVAALVIGLGISTWAFFKEQKALTRALRAEAQQSREREKAEQAGQAAALERDRAARLLSVSQAQQGVKLLERNDPVGLLHLLEARKSVEHLPEERLRRTLLWSGWMDSLPKPEEPGVQAGNFPGGEGETPGRPWHAIGSTNGMVTLVNPLTRGIITTFDTESPAALLPELSANGRLLVVKATGRYQLWNLAPVLSNQPPHRLLARISRFAFDPIQQRVVTSADQGAPLLPGERPETQPTDQTGFKIQVWDSVAEPALIATWEGDRRDLVNHQFALSPDGTRVAAAWKTSLTLWDARTGASLRPQPDTAGMTASLDSFVPPLFSPNGQWLWEFRARSCRRYELATGQPVGESVTNLHRSRRPWVTPDRRHLVLTLEDGIRVVGLASGDSLGPVIRTGDEPAAHAAALSLDGSRLATTGPDRAIRVWDTRTGQMTRDVIVPPFAITSVSFTPDRQHLTVSSRDGQSQTYAVAAQAPASVRIWSGVTVLGFNARGQLLTYAPGQQTMEWRDPATGRAASAGWTVADRGPVLGSALSAEGGTVAVAFRTGRMQSLIFLWNTATGALLEPSITWTTVGALAFSPDGRTLAGLGGGDGSGSIQLWDVETHQPQAFLASTPMEVSWWGLRYSPDGRFIAARNSYVTYVWDLAARRLASGAKQDLYLAISEDWTRALTDDLQDFTDPRQPRPAPNPVTSRGTPTKRGGMALSPDGRLRVAESGNKSIRLWDCMTGRPVGQEMKLANPSRQMVFSPDSRLLVVFEWDLFSGGSGAGKTLRLWETSTGLPCGPALAISQQPVEFLFDREVRFLVVPASDETAGTMILDLPDGELPLAEMERRSWLLARSRLDEAGNVEALSAEEIGRLEASKESAARPALRPKG